MSVAERLSEWVPFLWYLLVVAVLFYLWYSGILGRLFDRMTKFGGLGLTFEFDAESARETRDSVEEGLAAVRVSIQRNLAAEVRARGLQEAFRSLVRLTPLVDKSGYRCAIHIPDPLYANQLFQLLDYYPKGGGSGRTFSSRSGIIGIAWRNLELDTWHQHSNITTHELMRQWGMTPEEAVQREAADSKKFFLAMPLFDPTGAIPIGVFYFDASSPEDLGMQFQDDAAVPNSPEEAEPKRETEVFFARLETKVRDEFNRTMARPLAELVEKAKMSSPQIDMDGR